MLRGVGSFVAAAVLGVSLVGAVAGAPRAGAAPLVDHERLAQQVAATVAPAFPDLAVSEATCPKRIVRKVGTAAVCEVIAGGVSLELKVTQTDRKGKVTIESTQAVIPKTKAEDFVRNNATLPVAADCGADPYIVRLPGTPFACTARFDDGTTRQVIVAVNDVAGNVTITQVL